MKKENIWSLAVAFVFFSTILSCSEGKFEKEVWTAKSDANFPPQGRGEMLHDLLSSYNLVGLKYSDAITLLGDPDGIDSSSLSYKIEIDYGSDIDPVYSKDLYLFMAKDSVISSYEIKEWKKE